MAERAVPDDLPPVLAVIAAAAGEDVALRIARAHGGTRVTMPVGAGANWLTVLVGNEAAAAIVEALGAARRVDVPLGPEGGFMRLSRRQLEQELERMEAAGASNSQMARALGIPDRRVRRWRATRRASWMARQGKLFG